MTEYCAAACDRTVSGCDWSSVSVGPRHVDDNAHDVMYTVHAPNESHTPDDAHAVDDAQQRPPRHDPDAHKDDAEHDAPGESSAHAPLASQVEVQDVSAQQ